MFRESISVLDHTADMGFAVQGESLQRVFELAGLALMTILTEPQSLKATEHIDVSVSGSDLDSLMYNWLSEILYLFDGEHKLFCGFSITALGRDSDGFQLEAKLAGEPYRQDLHEIKTYVKAITFHQMEITQADDICTARVFIDI